MMPEYRRAYRPGGTFFFTLVTYNRRPLFEDPANVERLRTAMRAVREQWPFEPVAGVVMFDHAHLIWTLPTDDADYSKRIGRMKALFTKSLVGWAPPTDSADGGQCPPYTGKSRRRHREADVWQRRFWEHLIRDETDYENHFNYLHYNPVKHGLCACPHGWPASSFGRWAKQRMYEPDWCCKCKSGKSVIVPYPANMDGSVGE